MIGDPNVELILEEVNGYVVGEPSAFHGIAIIPYKIYCIGGYSRVDHEKATIWFILLIL